MLSNLCSNIVMSTPTNATVMDDRAGLLPTAPSLATTAAKTGESAAAPSTWQDLLDALAQYSCAWTDDGNGLMHDGLPGQVSAVVRSERTAIGGRQRVEYVQHVGGCIVRRASDGRAAKWPRQT